MKNKGISCVALSKKNLCTICQRKINCDGEHINSKTALQEHIDKRYHTAGLEDVVNTDLETHIYRNIKGLDLHQYIQLRNATLSCILEYETYPRLRFIDVSHM